MDVFDSSCAEAKKLVIGNGWGFTCSTYTGPLKRAGLAQFLILQTGLEHPQFFIYIYIYLVYCVISG